MKSDTSIQTLLDFALEACWEAGKLTLEYFQTNVAVEQKSDLSPVTIADRRAEQFLRERITGAFPTHAVLGEEYGRLGPDGASHRWIVDPIDGTKSFIRGVPLFGTMLGLERDGEAIVGVVAFPPLDEVVAAGRGLGCRLNGRRAHVSACTDLADAFVCYTDAFHFEKVGKGAAFRRVLNASKLNRSWGDCYGHCLVATGRVDVMLDAAMNLWDNAALLPILEEAGGTFTDWQGVRTIHGADGFSTNGHLYGSVMNEFRQAGYVS